MKNIEILTVAFSSLSDSQLKRLDRYEKSGKKFLCGKKDATWFCRNGLG